MRQSLFFAAALLHLASAHNPVIGKRAPIQAVGIEKNKEGFGSPATAIDEAQAALAPPSLEGKKNATVPQLKDRSMELVDRQSCDAGYWYCSGFGSCCPTTSNCCNYGYCIDPDATCCPDGPCDPGWTCCSANSCAPKDGECCSDGNYCEAGNMCVILGSNGQHVCCTDLECTAAVVSGSTSYLTTSTEFDEPSITAPPLTTEFESFEASATIVDQYYYWYWTVTWWYLSFYWTTFRTESTVTYESVYETTTYTTTASDESEASSLFFALSESLTFTPPAAADTSLASLLDVQPSETEAPSPSFDIESTAGPSSRSSLRPAASSETTTSDPLASVPIVTQSNANGPPGGASLGTGVFVQWGLVGMGLMSGLLMVLL